MDDRLEKALEHSNYKASLNQKRETMRLKFENDTLFAINGGMFSINPQLITYVATLISQGDTSAIVLDQRGNPIMIGDLGAFLNDIRAHYTAALNGYYTEYEKLRKARTVKSILEV